MGAIQGSINQIMGSIATAAVAGKHFSNQAANRLDMAKEGEIKLAEEMPEIKGSIESLNEKKKTIESDKNDLGDLINAVRSPEDAEAYLELSAEVNRDEKMAELAMTTLNQKLKARKSQLERFDKTIQSKGWR